MANLIRRTRRRSEPFVQEPLQDPDKQIRLLELVPGQAKGRENIIRCQLVVRGVDGSAGSSRWYPIDEYVAISYTWGLVSPTTPIEINGHTCEVQYNCWLALWQMRLHDAGKLYWIDVVCIDQDNPSEKAGQVRLMGQIYSQAKVVAASVGEVGSDLALILGEMGAVPLGMDLQPALQIFASRAYFYRLWTLQEFLLGRDLDVFGGQCRVGFWPLYSRIVNIPGNETACKDLRKLCKDRSELLSSSGLNFPAIQLSDLILRYSKRLCSDPRDKVYGLLSSLPSLESRRMLPVDYSCTLFDLLLRYVGAEKNLLIKGPGRGWQRYTAEIARLHVSSASIGRLIDEFTRASDTFADALTVHVRKQIKEAAHGHVHSMVSDDQSTPTRHRRRAYPTAEYVTGPMNEKVSHVHFGINLIFRCSFYCCIPPSEQRCPRLSPQCREFVAGEKWHEAESTDFLGANSRPFFDSLLRQARAKYLNAPGGDANCARARKLLLTRDINCNLDGPSDCKYLLVPLETAPGDYIVHFKGAANSVESRLLLVCRRRRTSLQSSLPRLETCYDVIGEASHINYESQPPHAHLSANLQLGALPMDFLLASLSPPHPLARMVEERAFADSVSRPPLRLQFVGPKNMEALSAQFVSPEEMEAHEDWVIRRWYGKRAEVKHFCPSADAAASCGCVFQGS